MQEYNIDKSYRNVSDIGSFSKNSHQDLLGP